MKKIHFLTDGRKASQSPYAHLIASYGQCPLEEAQVFVVLGGDGFMLHSLRQHYDKGIPFYGLNFGHVGFLLNRYSAKENLEERLEKAQKTTLYPLSMTVKKADGSFQSALAINEVSLLRQTHQTAKIEIRIDGAVCMPELIADGILLSTPAGSTAYNASIQGPILPLGSALLALTPISPFRPRRWRGALLKNTSRIELVIHDPLNRPVSASADSTEVRFVQSICIFEDHHTPLHLLFDPQHLLEKRIFLEQFQ